MSEDPKQLVDKSSAVQRGSGSRTKFYSGHEELESRK